MGLSRSKPREKKVEEPKKSPTNFVAKSKDKVMETKQPDKEALNQPAENLLFGAGIAKHSKPSSSSEGRRPEETCHVKASGMGPIPKTLMTQETNLILNKSRSRRKVSLRRSSSLEPQMRR
ncbi:spermatogenesis-associated protein 33 isoform X2 [Cricetulus griseus]|uniref:Spermatogenesis-associated protein 33 isoform X2 n=1 Tax=Cricetulus griseus TaxID=10029 RepID=A0A9J7GUG8_CRIGR|nr:spermatogenesis-associated protein 33 isoform X2 [Cricetulus griseus]XP_035298637.1 spermatogenesis-associated protein 33 isoform X2 [Cricetulus griseus]